LAQDFRGHPRSLFVRICVFSFTGMAHGPGSSILFLDIDGVLLPFGDDLPEGFTFPDSCLAALSRILESSGAQIVLTSTWRCDESAIQSILDQFRAFAAKQGGPLAESTFFDFTSTTNHDGRCKEINQWLSSPPALGVEAWVALDDEPLRDPHFQGHAVQTESHMGLTHEAAELAVTLLRRQWGAVPGASSSSSSAAAAPGAGAEVTLGPAPMPLERDLSHQYSSRGASRYDEATLQRWQRHRELAMAALKRKDWAVVVGELRHAVALRPDWSQGHFGLHEALTRMGQAGEADSALRRATSACLAQWRQELETCQTFEGRLEGITHETMMLVAKVVEKIGPDASCRELGTATKNKEGEPCLLYQNITWNAPWLAGAQQPLKLVFLDIDGVLNTAGSANTGGLDPVLVKRFRGVLERTGAVAMLSTSWRSFDELRPLAIQCLPPGLVIGQTPAGFQNHVRPREIFDALHEPRVQAALQVPGASWAVVDDMNLLAQAEDLAAGDKKLRAFVPQLQQRFVRTDKSIGLDEASAARLMELLG